LTPTLSLLISDQLGEPPADAAGSGEVWGWHSFSQSGTVFSIPRYLEDHAPRIRQRYLSFVHDLGETVVRGKRVIDHLDLGDGFSLWWMTLIAEKSPLKSPALYACLRLIALQEILQQRRPGEVSLVSADAALAESISRLCASQQVGFSWKRCKVTGRRWSARGLYEALPHALQGLLSVRHILKRWPLRKVARGPWASGDHAVFICSYFIHLDAARCQRGEFYSRQWEALPELLHSAGRQINWIHLFLFSAAVPDTATGLGWVRRFNQSADEQGRHAFVDSELSLRTVWTTLTTWSWLLGAGWRLRKISAAFDPGGCAAWLWPMLRNDWGVSLAGTTAMSNCLALALFDAALAGMPRQRLGLYLHENQSWEKALLRAWRKHGHGEIIGVQHATVPFWHLYYFDDPRCFIPRQTGTLPLPDRLAANGLAARNSFAAMDYPVERIVEVEALRYLHLLGLSDPRAPGAASAAPSWPVLSARPTIRVLVLGDLIPASMHYLLRLLEEATPRVTPRFEFTLKPHPGLTVDLAAYPGLRAGETREGLGAILAGFDIAIAANCTSAAVEAFIAGLPVIISMDGEGLNLSPLRDQPGVRFVCTGAELAAALQAALDDPPGDAGNRQEFFYLSSDLPRWKRLLALNTAD
jgi:surface carbohydrate biosynthesis protein (TIGR04326 family)